MVFSGGSSQERSFVFKGHVEDAPSDKWQYFVVSDTAKLADFMGLIRKDQHIEICRSQDVESKARFTGFSRVSFMPCALPELDEEDLDTKTRFLGRDFSFPMMIVGMTGGIAKGKEINQRLARTASKFGIPMGIGSQRLALENKEHAAIFSVKKEVSDLFLVGNVGCAQLVAGDARDICQRAVDMIEADALAIHLNVLQESVQVEGDRRFRGFMKKIEDVCRYLPVPIILKEVGCGVSVPIAKRLFEAGVSAIDIGGKGGTSWGYIEGLRSGKEATRRLGEEFRDWGIPTAYNLSAVRDGCPEGTIIATGGMRSGLDMAKACALGADMVGVGLPLLRAALLSEEAVFEEVALLERGLRVAMVASGARKVGDLAGRVCLGEPYEEAFLGRFLKNRDQSLRGGALDG